jgi:photosystem II stability/assembly factor-like uncharacterized protein
MIRTAALVISLCAMVHAATAAENVDRNAPGGEFKVRGLGGAGGMFVPSVSPFDPNLMLVACDMSGSYRSLDGGRSWELIHCLQMSDNSQSAFPAFFPNRIYWNRGSELRMSDDKAKTWRSVTDKFPWGESQISSLSALPGKPDVLLVSTSNGLYRTENDGKSFAQVLGSPAKGIVAFGDRLFTFSGENTFQTSGDRGRTWAAAQVALLGDNGVFGFTGGKDAAGSVLFASVWNVGIIRSRDEGKSWQVVLNKYDDQRILAMASGQTRIVYAAQNGGGWCRNVWSSLDGGDTWGSCFRMGGDDSNVEPSWVQTLLHWGYYISPNGFYASLTDPNLAMLTTQGDFYITRDGGRTWRPCMNETVGVQPGDPGVRFRSTGLEVTSCWGYYFDPFDKSREIIAYTDIGLARTVDNGKTWIWSGKGSPWVNTFYSLVFDPDVKGRIYAACSNRHDIPHWTHISPNDPKNDSHVGGVCISDDSAVTWKVPGTGLPLKPCTDICLDPGSPRDARVLYTTIFGEGVFKSTDGGKTWTKKSEGLGNAGNLHVYRIRRHPVSGNLYCLITACREGQRDFRVPGGIWKSTDGGESWKDITEGIRLVWPTNLVIDPADENRIFMTAATSPGKQQGGVYRTLDAGRTWRHVLTDADVAKSGGDSYDHFMSVAISPGDPQLVYSGSSSHGLWYSLDGGNKWNHRAGFPFKNVQSINFHPVDHRKLYITTFGGGVWVGPHLPSDK